MSESVSYSTLLTMGLHEELKIDVGDKRHSLYILRVPNGWIYSQRLPGSEEFASVFVSEGESG